MGPDDRVCYCYNVSLRKLASFARRHTLIRPSQLSDCLGAGTGCGWCIPTLKRIFEAAQSPTPSDLLADLSPEQYEAGRRAYIENRQPRNRF